jgi:hypothetical protein
MILPRTLKNGLIIPKYVFDCCHLSFRYFSYAIFHQMARALWRVRSATRVKVWAMQSYLSALPPRHVTLFPFSFPSSDSCTFCIFYPSSPATQDIAFGRRRSMDSSTLQQAIGVLTTGKRSTRDDCPGNMNWKEGVKPGKSNIRSYLFTPASASSAFAESGSHTAVNQWTFLKVVMF